MKRIKLIFTFVLFGLILSLIIGCQEQQTTIKDFEKTSMKINEVERNQTLYESDTLTSIEENALYQDLWKKHPDHQNLALPYRGIIESGSEIDPVWVVWMTESSPIGEGIIGIYDSQHKLRDMRTTGPIKYIETDALNKETDVLIVKEVSGTGTGLYEKTMSILDVGNLNAPLWSGKVESWLEGLEGRNEGHLLHSIVLLLDLDCDGTKELLVVKLKQVGTDLQKIVFGRILVECKVFSFDPQIYKFVIQNKIQPHILYPLPPEKEDKF